MMKKYWPFIALGVGVVVVIAAVVVVRGRGASTEVVGDEEPVRELTLDEKPFTSLTPTEDGHFLQLLVENIAVQGAESAEYELLYTVEDGRTQGVPGIIQLSKTDEIDVELLLGSESSGVFRYDEGVDEGQLTLRFRDGNGRLVGRLITKFSLLTETNELAMPDGSFAYTLDDETEDYHVVMETFGLPPETDLDGELAAGPYGIFNSSGDLLEGEVTTGANTELLNNVFAETSSSE